MILLELSLDTRYLAFAINPIANALFSLLDPLQGTFLHTFPVQHTSLPVDGSQTPHSLLSTSAV